MLLLEYLLKCLFPKSFPFELPYVVKIYSATFPCGDETKEVFTFRHIPYPDREELKNEAEGEAQSLKKYDRVVFTC